MLCGIVFEYQLYLRVIQGSLIIDDIYLELIYFSNR